MITSEAFLVDVSIYGIIYQMYRGFQIDRMVGYHMHGRISNLLHGKASSDATRHVVDIILGC